ncbi:hypothetical protein [Rhodopirellula europaea]|uniref:hypothetical protein n=1 Tax=Rhodopirellula europaea TaxID=1263866 RepID=UPI003D27BF39
MDRFDHAFDIVVGVDAETQQSVDVDNIKPYAAEDTIHLADVASPVKVPVSEAGCPWIEIKCPYRGGLLIKQFRIARVVATSPRQHHVGRLCFGHRRKHNFAKVLAIGEAMNSQIKED